LTKNPGSGGVVVITDDDGEIKVFDTQDEAEELAQMQTMCVAWGYQIVELDL
jgi:hypothetical protein